MPKTVQNNTIYTGKKAEVKKKITHELEIADRIMEQLWQNNKLTKIVIAIYRSPTTISTQPNTTKTIMTLIKTKLIISRWWAYGWFLFSPLCFCVFFKFSIMNTYYFDNQKKTNIIEIAINFIKNMWQKKML